MPQVTVPYECSIHDFSTESITEFKQHLNDVDHTVSGSTKCSDCGCACENDSEEKVRAGPGAASAKCAECQEKDVKRVLKKLEKEGRTDEILAIKKKK